MYDVQCNGVNRLRVHQSAAGGDSNSEGREVRMKVFRGSEKCLPHRHLAACKRTIMIETVSQTYSAICVSPVHAFNLVVSSFTPCITRNIRFFALKILKILAADPFASRCLPATSALSTDREKGRAHRTPSFHLPLC